MYLQALWGAILMSEKPKRLQRKRSLGFRLDDVCTNPNGWVYVGRPSKWGNPWSVKQFGRENAVKYFEAFMKNWACEWHVDALNVDTGDLGGLDLSELRGKDLACWCPLDQPCHADILLELANA